MKAPEPPELRVPALEEAGGAGSAAKTVNVLLSTAHGLMLVNRLEIEYPFGVARELADRGALDIEGLTLLRSVARALGSESVAWDVGANLGVHTVELSRLCRWVVALEAQRILFQLLCANVALNHRLNVLALWKVVSRASGCRWVPFIDYRLPGSFGSLELEPVTDENVGAVDRERGEWVESICLDELGGPSPQLIKIDVEGMELEVLAGGARLLREARPVIWIEWIKSNPRQLASTLFESGYEVFRGSATDWLAVARERPLALTAKLERLEMDRIPRAYEGGSFRRLDRSDVPQP